ncbi:MAG: hypothetical protein HC860_20885 [Alkalinema sp. RU_4_3]|nr:hypothetical protein [Alkalinema sp. RU_4_3]
MARDARSDSRKKPADRTDRRFARSSLQKMTADRPWNRMMRDRFSEVMAGCQHTPSF